MNARRIILTAGLALSLGGCAGVPAAVVWGTVGAGLGYAASVNGLATEIIKVKESTPKPEATDGNT